MNQSGTMSATSWSCLQVAVVNLLVIAGGRTALYAQVTVEQTVNGSSISSASVATGSSITGVTDHLYLAAISTKSYRDVTSVTGLGLTWTKVGEQCGGRSQTNTEVWKAQGGATTGVVTANLSSTPETAVISVTRISGTDPSTPIGAVVQENTNGVDGACTGGTDTTGYSVSITTTVDDGMLYGAVGTRQRTHTPGSGFTEIDELKTSIGGGQDAGVATEQKASGIAGAYTVDGTLSSDTDYGAVAVEIYPPLNATPDAASSLGSAGYVDGSCKKDTTPTLEFTQSDDDVADTLAFQIQIDDSSDFSSAVVDYQSAALAQGATSFTVGQAAGGGSYTTGSAGQTLANGNFYWRVRSSDGSAWGDWATANSGSIAFEMADFCGLVGPSGAGACKGADCDYSNIQGAIDAASPGDTITLHFNDDTEYAPAHTDNNCFNEHLVINVANVTIQGDSTSPISAACIGPSSGGDAVIKITASGVTLKNLDISGKANDGSDGLNGSGGGGRSSGYGILIEGNDVDDVVIENCTISFNYLENIRWDGDQDNDNNGNVTIRNCYLHHSDLPRQNIRIIGGSASGDPHVIENNLITTGDGIFSDAEYITVQKNIISGYPYWGHLANSSYYPETHDYNSQQSNFGGGWRYFSRCSAGVHIQNGGAGTDININNNLIVGTRVGIRVQTTGTIANNTVANPFNIGTDFTDVTAIRDNTFGIMLVSGFSGVVRNNIVVVTEDNRATGQPHQKAYPKYTSGITGTGIGFFGGSGSLTAGTAIANNNVWGFVDTDGSTATNWGGGLETCGDNTDAKCSNNISRDPQFAGDTSDETNDGMGGCDADADDSRCYELYHDNYFLKTDRASGGCHADIRPNTAAYVGYVDMTSSYDIAGLGTCSTAADSGTPSTLIDFGSGAVSSEPGIDGGYPNLGAFGNTDRASQSPSLRIVEIDVGDGGVKNDDNDYAGPGIVQARKQGLTEVNLYFNRAPTLNGLSSFEFRNICDSGDVATAPTLDTSASTAPPFKVNFTWPADTYVNRGIRIHALADDAVNKIVDYQLEKLDGEISDIDTGTLPSGNGTAGGDAEFVVYSLIGDVDGDRDVDTTDRSAVTALDGSTTAVPEDVDGDGTVEGSGAEDDYVLVDDRRADHWVNSTADTLSATTLRQALTDVADGETIKFDIATFDTCQSAVIDVDSSALPALDNDNVTIDASATTQRVVIEDTDSDLADANDGLVISGDGNTLYGMNIQNFDAGASSYGVYISGASNTIGGTATNQAITITGNGAAGLYATGAAADGNTWRANVIHNNTGIAVDLAGDGANDDLAVPVVTKATPAQVQGTAANNATVDVFTNDDGNSNCEVYVGSTTADGSGSWTLGSLSLTMSHYAVAVQTDGDGDSSEVSAAKPVSFLVNTLVDENDGSCTDGDCSLRDALTLVANGQGIYFDTTVFPPGTPATIDVDSTTLPALDNSNVTIDASDAGVIIDDTDNDLGTGHGLALSGGSNTVMGLQIKNFDKDAGSYGIYITGASNAIGGVYNGGAANQLGQGCLVSSNGRGIVIDGDAADNNVIQGCLIGTNLAGTAALMNDNEGIGIYEGDSNTIGGDRDDGYGNLISGNNKQGILLDNADSNVIKGNYIGTDINGTGDLGNNDENIKVDGSESNVIGSITPGEGNTVAYSAGKEGIRLSGPSHFNSMRGNVVFDNAHDAIENGATGNQGIDPPTIDTAGTTQVDGSGADASAAVDVYTNTDGDDDCLVYVGTATADGSGDWTLTGLSLTAGHYVVANQTDGSGNSSALANAVVVP